MFEEINEQLEQPIAAEPAGHVDVVPGELVGDQLLGQVEDRVDTTAVGATDRRGLTASHDLPLPGYEGDSHSPADGSWTARADGSGEAMEPGSAGPPEPPEDGNGAQGELSPEPEPVDPGFHRYDGTPPEGYAEAPGVLRAATAKAIDRYSDFADELPLVDGRTLRVVKLESTEPDVGRPVYVSANSSGTLSIAGRGNPELLRFTKHPARPDLVVRNSFDGSMIADLPPAGAIPWQMAHEITGQRAELARGIADVVEEVEGEHVVGAAEMERARDILARGTPQRVSLAELDDTLLARMESVLEPETGASQEAGGMFATDIDNYLTRDGHARGALAEEVQKIVKPDETLTVRAGTRMDIPLPARPLEDVDTSNLTDDQLARLSTVEDLPLERVHFVDITYSRPTPAHVVEAERAAAGEDAGFPLEFTGGTVDIEIGFRRDETGQLVGTRQVVFRNTDGSESRSSLWRTICDEAERRKVRNHINNPKILEED